MTITEEQAQEMMDTICEYISRTCGTFVDYREEMYEVIINATGLAFMQICDILNIEEIETGD